MLQIRALDVFRSQPNRLCRWAITCLALLALTLPVCAQTYVDLFDFNCNTGGCSPINFGQLTQGADGNFYGTAEQGGFHQFGTVFQLTSSGGYSDIWQFDGISGGDPFNGLTLASDGNFYGTTIIGGSANTGTLFQLASGPSFTVLHNFSTAEGLAVASPVQGKDGNLYGFTANGIAYRVTLPAGTYQQLPNNVPFVTGELVLASDGNLYGTTFEGGSFNLGTVFRMTTNGAIQTIYNFSGLDGVSPSAPLMQAADGNLYGTTYMGGANDTGTAFKITLTGQLTTLHSFDAESPNGNNDGANPVATLLPASDGFFYGVTTNGGALDLGTVFRVSSGGGFNKLFDFTGAGGSAPGETAFTTPVQHTSGRIYGLTTGNNAQDFGNFYQLSFPNLSEILKVVGPIFVLPGVPVQVLGNNLTQTFSVAFAGENTSFRAGADTVLTAQVPQDAIDGPITVTYVTGLQVQTLLAMHILPVITNLDPTTGPPGTQVGIVGGGFSRASKVTFGGVKANFTVVNPTLIQAIVPARAKSGKVKVTTPNGVATSRQKFTVN